MTTPYRLFSPRRSACGVTLAVTLLLAGCAKTDVASYRVPKEKDVSLPVTVATNAAPTAANAAAPGSPHTSAGGEMAGAPVATASGNGLTWTAPATWQAKPLGVMRKGSFTITGGAGVTADLSITAFPGAVGGEFANVNRWRGQLGLAPIAEADLATAVTHLSQNGLTFTFVDLASTDAANAQRMLGAMAPFDGAMWFFKLSGPDAVVAAAKPAFLEFLKTVKSATP